VPVAERFWDREAARKAESAVSRENLAARAVCEDGTRPNKSVRGSTALTAGR